MIGLTLSALVLSLGGLLWLLLGLGRKLSARFASPQAQRLTLPVLYLLFLVLVLGTLAVFGLSGVGASSEVSFVAHDVATRLALSASASPSGAARVGTLIESYLVNLAMTGALFALSLAYFSRACLFPGQSVAPGGSLCPGGRVLALVWVFGLSLSKLASGIPRGAGEWLLVLLTPLVASEAVFGATSLLFRARARGALTAIALVALILSPELALFAAGAGVGFVWLRSVFVLEPLLPRTLGFGPSRRHVWAVAAALALGLAVLTAADQRALAAASPLVGTGPSLCAQVERSQTPSGDVAFASPTLRFVVARTESRSEDPLTSHAEAGAVCAAQGKRLCTSDEWYLACLCTYPQDSREGLQWTGNSLLAHNVQRERAGQGVERRDIAGLLEGASEIVAGGKPGSVLIAGAHDGGAGSFMSDCRYRARVTELALSENEWEFLGVRCCR